MKHLLFDFDGTLVDSMPSFSAVMLKILDEGKVNYPKDVIKIITPLGFSKTIKYFVELGHPFAPEKIAILMRDYLLDAYTNHIPAKSNVIDTLKVLKERGYSMHVLTASPHATLDPCLKRLNIFDMFDNVWSCDDFNTSKADPNIYLEVAKRINTTVNDIVFFDDNLSADQTAKSARLATCGVYDDSSKEFIEEMKRTNDYYIYDFSEILKLKI